MVHAGMGCAGMVLLDTNRGGPRTSTRLNNHDMDMLKLFSRVLAAGTLLRSFSLPTALYAVAADPAEHALYLAGGDGRIFEASLVGDGEARAAARACNGHRYEPSEVLGGLR